MISLAVQQTGARVAQARRLGLLPQRRAVPRPRPPTLIESDYAGRLVGIVDRMRTAARHLAGVDQPGALRLDDHPGAKARRRAQRVRAELDGALNDTHLEGVAEEFGRRVSKHQRAELARQAEAALGTDVVTFDPAVADLIEGFVHENVALITKLEGATLGELEAIITRAAADGTRAETVQQLIEDRFGIAERHARLLARDQVGKLNSRITEARHAELGLKSYIWIHVTNRHPRPHHVARNGTSFRYDTPPYDGHPGMAICCHCLQQPDFQDIYAELDALGV